MTASRKARLLTLVVALLIGGAVWAASAVQTGGANDARDRQADAQLLLTGMLDMETAARGFQLTGQEEFLEPFATGRRHYDAALAELGPDASATIDEDLATADGVARRWQARADAVIAEVRRDGAHLVPGAEARKALFDRFRAAHAKLLDDLESERRDEARSASLLTAGLALLLALVIGVLGDVVLGRRIRGEAARRAAEVDYRSTQSEFVETLQLADDEAEADDLLRRHVERTVSGSEVVVLRRNNSADRLEPATRVADADIAERLEGAAPRSCLAVRLGREAARDGARDPLLACDICGASPGCTTCKPLIVGSEVIGSRLVTHSEPLDDIERQRLRDSVAQAAPALANLRNLALAENRAATDALTGLPNRRAIEDTLKRMIAQASRTMTPLSALMVDLDHFKTINDLYGHELGDEALAATGTLLRESLRESDFAGRQGGEEFIVLAPDTDAAGAAVLAENLRAAIAGLRLDTIDHTLSASIGVATFPDVASGATGLVRMADRALYAAKERGRNRVEVAHGSGGAEAPADA